MVLHLNYLRPHAESADLIDRWLHQGTIFSA